MRDNIVNRTGCNGKSRVYECFSNLTTVEVMESVTYNPGQFLWMPQEDRDFFASNNYKNFSLSKRLVNIAKFISSTWSKNATVELDLIATI